MIYSQVPTKLLVFVFIISSAASISTKYSNDTAEILFELANYAVESRQNFNNPYLYRPPYLPINNHLNHLKPPSFYRPQSNYYTNAPFPVLQGQQSVMDVLYSISRNDKLRCVPRLLCELTSDTISTRARQSFSLPNLPININMDSIIGILSTLDAASGSPLTSFAKAALLGYTSKGNSDRCLGEYPTCPRDADRLVQYLNNYNGGFFRFFSGIHPQLPASHRPQSTAASYGFLNYPPPPPPPPPGYYPYHNDVLMAEQRIQTRPVQYVSNNYVGNSDGIVFFPDDSTGGSLNNLNNRSPKSVAFPTDPAGGGFNKFNTFNRPFSINYYYSNELDFQKPLPNHQASPTIFPVRTGTGDLRLDADELNENYKQTQYNLQNNNLISFNSPPTNEAFYLGAGGHRSEYDNNRNNRALFSFPL